MVGKVVRGAAVPKGKDSDAKARGAGSLASSQSTQESDTKEYPISSAARSAAAPSGAVGDKTGDKASASTTPARSGDASSPASSNASSLASGSSSSSASGSSSRDLESAGLHKDVDARVIANARAEEQVASKPAAEEPTGSEPPVDNQTIELSHVDDIVEDTGVEEITNVTGALVTRVARQVRRLPLPAPEDEGEDDEEYTEVQEKSSIGLLELTNPGSGVEARSEELAARAPTEEGGTRTIVDPGYASRERPTTRTDVRPMAGESTSTESTEGTQPDTKTSLEAPDEARPRIRWPVAAVLASLAVSGIMLLKSAVWPSETREAGQPSISKGLAEAALATETPAERVEAASTANEPEAVTNSAVDDEGPDEGASLAGRDDLEEAIADEDRVVDDASDTDVASVDAKTQRKARKDGKQANARVAKGTKDKAEGKQLESKASKPGADSRKQAAELYKAGTSAFLAGDLGAAERSFQSALKADAGYGLALRGLGLVYERQGQRTKALSAFRRYLRRSPGAKDADKIEERIARLKE